MYVGMYVCMHVCMYIYIRPFNPSFCLRLPSIHLVELAFYHLWRDNAGWRRVCKAQAANAILLASCLLSSLMAVSSGSLSQSHGTARWVDFIAVMHPQHVEPYTSSGFTLTMYFEPETERGLEPSEYEGGLHPESGIVNLLNPGETKSPSPTTRYSYTAEA